MLVRKSLSSALATVVLALAAASSQAEYPAVVSVGDAGNSVDSNGYGAVKYKYQIGKYEVTNEEYCAFLNAVAKSDPHSLYDGRMAEQYGGIFRSGGDGSFKYDVKDGMGKKPVGYVTWESAARYANWLTNGQKDGGETEKGAYEFSGDSATAPDHAELAEGKETVWVLPSENEWYKAAYYDPKKAGGAGYWVYPAKSDSEPSANLNSDAPSDAGSYESYPSPYGTFDQGGNMWEYNDYQSDGKVGLRGGSFYINDHAGYMRSETRYDVLSAKWPNYGFRVAAVGGDASK
jgi:formylglycine-generating enzyme required for sulfatase activity